MTPKQSGPAPERLPLRWSVYGDHYRLTEEQLRRYRRTGHFY